MDVCIYLPEDDDDEEEEKVNDFTIGLLAISRIKLSLSLTSFPPPPPPFLVFFFLSLSEKWGLFVRYKKENDPLTFMETQPLCLEAERERVSSCMTEALFQERERGVSGS